MPYTDNKPFCRKTWAQYDQLSKDSVKSLAEDLWDSDVFEHHDEYLDGKCGDLVVIHRETKAARVLETEVKNHWRNGRGSFPYKTVRFPQRKQRPHFSSVAAFCIVSSDGNGVLIFGRKDIMAAEPFLAQARNHDKEESWIEVDITKAKLYRKDVNGDWERL